MSATLFWRRVLVTLTLALTSGAANAQSLAPTPQERARIQRILSQTPLIDGHNDLPWEIHVRYGGEPRAIDLNANTAALATPDQIPLQTDFARMRLGMVGGQFWSVYVPAELHGAVATDAVRRQIELVRRMIAAYPDQLAFAQSADDIVRIHRRGRIASMLGMEGGEVIAGDLALLRDFRARGVLYMTLTHETTIDWVDSATDTPRNGGLSPFGEAVVREMNRIGMLVDLSHVSADAMRDALRVSTAPVIFSHSSAFALTRHPRNVPDDVLDALRVNDGIVMVNFYRLFVSEEHRQRTAALEGERARLRELFPGDPAARRTGVNAWVAAHPRPSVTVAQVADHIEHIRDIAGVAHVGLGADFDGMPDPSDGLEDVSTYPKLFTELMRRGWSDRDLARLAGGNLLRVLRRAEAAAARSGRN